MNFSAHIYIHILYYIFSLHKRLLLRANEKSRKKRRNSLRFAFQVLESCLIYYTRSTNTRSTAVSQLSFFRFAHRTNRALRCVQITPLPADHALKGHRTKDDKRQKQPNYPAALRFCRSKSATAEAKC